MNDGKIVLEEGEHMEYLHSLLVFALFEDVMLSCCETAGYVRFALFTSGYGYSPPSATLWQATTSSAATLSRDDKQFKKCLLCTCESLVYYTFSYRVLLSKSSEKFVTEPIKKISNKTKHNDYQIF